MDLAELLVLRSSACFSSPTFSIPRYNEILIEMLLSERSRDLGTCRVNVSPKRDFLVKTR